MNYTTSLITHTQGEGFATDGTADYEAESLVDAATKAACVAWQEWEDNATETGAAWQERQPVIVLVATANTHSLRVSVYRVWWEDLHDYRTSPCARARMWPF